MKKSPNCRPDQQCWTVPPGNLPRHCAFLFAMSTLARMKTQDLQDSSASRCGRIEYLFQTTKTQDKIKVHRKLYLSLPRIGILGVPSPNCMLRLQFWDGALLPPAVLGWHLLTCNILPPDLRWHLLTCKFFTCSIGMAPSHLQYLTCRFAMAPSHLQYFTCRFAMAPSHLENGFYRQICDSTFSP